MMNHFQMKPINLLMLILAFGLFTACEEDDDGDDNQNDNNATGTLTLSFNNLQDLGPDYVYEGWIKTADGPQTTGTFTVNENGEMSQSSFEVAQSTLDNGEAFILSIEPADDPDPAPSDIKVVAGDFADNMASLSVSHQAAIGTDFSNGSGQYIIATPTSANTTDESSGIWFLDNSGASPVAGLDLPALPAGWQYEGWVVMNGNPVTTGTFTDPASADDAAPYSGTEMAPPFPGEDFITNAPMGLSFPTDLAGMKVVISVEPMPDNSEMPFVLKPMNSTVSDPASGGTLSYDSSTLITGTATR